MERRRWLTRVGAAALGATAGQAQSQVRPAPQGTALEIVQMPAWRHGAGGREPLAPGDELAGGDEVETGEGGAVVIRMAEGSQVRLGEKARLGVPRLAVSMLDSRLAVRAEFKLLEGAFRFATSVTAKIVGQRDINVELRSANIGIRGTDFWLRSDETRDAACVFEGSVEIQTRDQGNFMLDKPTAFWLRVFNQPTRPVGTATPDELQRFLGSTELRPGRGVTLAEGRWRVLLEAANPREQLAALRAQGFPATVAGHELQIDRLASAADARFVLQRLGGRGRVVEG